jgi:PPOX class probable F420-dependent enzyme
LSDDRILIVVDDKPKSGKTLRRVQNIRENNSVAVLIDHYEDEWTALWWLLIRGAGEILEFEEFSEQQQLKISSTFRKKYRQYKELSFTDRTFISITIEVVSSWRFDSA